MWMSWRVSVSMDTAFCIEAVEAAHHCIAPVRLRAQRCYWAPKTFCNSSVVRFAGFCRMAASCLAR